MQEFNKKRYDNVTFGEDNILSSSVMMEDLDRKIFKDCKFIHVDVMASIKYCQFVGCVFKYCIVSNSLVQFNTFVDCDFSHLRVESSLIRFNLFSLLKIPIIPIRNSIVEMNKFEKCVIGKIASKNVLEHGNTVIA